MKNNNSKYRLLFYSIVMQIFYLTNVIGQVDERIGLNSDSTSIYLNNMKPSVGGNSPKDYLELEVDSLFAGFELFENDFAIDSLLELKRQNYKLNLINQVLDLYSRKAPNHFVNALYKNENNIEQLMSLLVSMGKTPSLEYPKSREQEILHDSIYWPILDSFMMNRVIEIDDFDNEIRLLYLNKLISEKNLSAILIKINDFAFLNSDSIKMNYLDHFAQLRYFNYWDNTNSISELVDSFFIANSINKSDITSFPFHLDGYPFLDSMAIDTSSIDTIINYPITKWEDMTYSTKLWQDTLLDYSGGMPKANDLRNFVIMSNDEIILLLDSIDLVKTYEKDTFHYSINSDTTAIWLRKIFQIIGDRHMKQEFDINEKQIGIIMDAVSKYLIFFKEESYMGNIIIDDSTSFIGPIDRPIVDESKEQILKLWTYLVPKYFDLIENDSTRLQTLGKDLLKIMLTEEILEEVIERAKITQNVQAKYHYKTILEYVIWKSEPNTRHSGIPIRRPKYTQTQALDWKIRLVDPAIAEIYNN